MKDQKTTTTKSASGRKVTILKDKLRRGNEAANSFPATGIDEALLDKLDAALAAPAASAPANVQDEKFLNEADLFRVRALQSELALAMSRKETSESAWKAKIYEQSDVIKKLHEAVMQAKAKWEQTVKLIEEKYRIDFREYSYDVETGKLNRLHG